MSNLGILAFFAGDCVGARAQYEEVIALFRAEGTSVRLSISLENLAFVALAQDLADESVELFEESAQIAQELGNQERMASVAKGLAESLIVRGETARAADLLADSLRISARLGEPGMVADCLDGFASLAQVDEQALVLLAAADEIRSLIGATVQPDQLARRNGRLARARAALTDDEVAEASERGRRLTLDGAVELALGEASATR